MSSKCISNVTQSWPQSGSPYWPIQGLKLYLQARAIIDSKYISKLTQLRSWSVSLSSLDCHPLVQQQHSQRSWCPSQTALQSIEMPSGLSELHGLSSNCPGLPPSHPGTRWHILSYPRVVAGATRCSPGCHQTSYINANFSLLPQGVPKGHCIGRLNSEVWPPWYYGPTTPSDKNAFRWCTRHASMSMHIVQSSMKSAFTNMYTLHKPVFLEHGIPLAIQCRKYTRSDNVADVKVGHWMYFIVSWLWTVGC